MRRPNLVGRVVASQMGTGSSRLPLRRRIDISKPTEPPAGAAGAQPLFDTRRSDLLSRMINKEVFEDEPPLPAV